MAMGIPATMRLALVPDGAFEEAVAMYVANGQRYRTDLRRLDGPAAAP